jgi:hypothetical protein
MQIMLPKTLQNIIDAQDFRELDILISILQWTHGNIQCAVVLSDEDDTDNRVDVKLSISNCLDFFFDQTNCYSSFSKLSYDDPLLWRFNDWQTGLYFNGTTNDRDKLSYELWKTHDSLLRDFLPFDRSIPKTLQQEFGLLTKGPKKLLDGYSKCLHAAGIKASVAGGYLPPESTLEPVILFLGNSYFIAPEKDIVAEIV